MKNSMLLIVGLLPIISIFGQNYFPVVEENKKWNVIYVIFPGPGYDTVYWTNTYKLEGDTIIDNLNYLKIYKSAEEIPESWTLEGCIREDQDKRVFFNNWGIDYLIYDFGAEVGDTIEINPNYSPLQVFVESIDSIMINGIFRKSIWLNYGPNSNKFEQWIEGVGSNRGILESGTAGYLGGWRWFLCMSQNGELIYMNPSFSSCYLISTGIEETNANEILIYPNPTRNKLILKIPDHKEIKSIKISDLKGQKIRDIEYNSPEIDLSGISSGIYLLTLTIENEVVVRKILIK